MRITRPATVCVALSLMFTFQALPVHAELDNKCMERWMIAIQLQTIGKKCKYAKSQDLKRFAKTEKDKLACVTAKATPEEKHMFETTMAKDMRKAALDGFKTAGCDDKVQRFYKGMSYLITK